MTDRFAETTTTGYGKRVTNSVAAMVIGFVLFIGSFGLLYWNEGRDSTSNSIDFNNGNHSCFGSPSQLNHAYRCY